MSFSAGASAILGGLALMAIWTVRAASWELARRRGDAQGRAAWFLAFPLTVVLVILLASYRLDVAHRIRFALSRSALEEVAESCLAGDHRERERCEPGRIGWYSIENVHRIDGGVIFTDGSDHFPLTAAGLVYLPAGPETSDDLAGTTTRHIEGPWYAWSSSNP